MAEKLQPLAVRPLGYLAPASRLGPPPSLPASQQLSLADVWQMVMRRRFAVFGFAIAVLFLAAAYAFLKTPVYEAIVRLQIDPDRSSDLTLDDAQKQPSSVDLDSRVKTEVAILQSDTVAMGVIKDLRLYSDRRFAGDDAVSGNIQDLSELSPSQRHNLLDRFGGNLIVKVVPGTQVVEVHFRSSDPQLATEAANSVVDEYIERNLHVRVDGTTQVSQWLSRQMDEIRAGTAAAQQKLADFQRVNNLLGTDESDNIVTDRLKQLNEELTQAEADRIVKEGRYRLARTGNPELIASVVPSTSLQVLRTQEADLQAQYAQISSKFGNGYPKVRELQAQLEQLETAINTEKGNVETRLANEYGAAAKAEGMIRDDFEKQKAAAYKLNENVAQYSILKHQVESGQQLYDTLQLKLKEAGVTSGLASSFVSIVDRAQVPDRPVEPRKTVYMAMGLGGGLFGGLLLGVLLDSFDDTVRSSDELAAITGLPELSSVPFVSALSRKRNKPNGTDTLAAGSGPITVRDPNSAGSEAFRALGSVVLLSSLDSPPKVIVVTSALPGEGKSTVSCNLATSLAQGGRRVLLVDADLRCSSLHHHLKISKGPGLATVFANRPTEYPRYQPIAELPNLHVVPAGFRPSGPTEILASPRMQQLLAAWRTEYDHIIIDTPPMLPFADALVLSARADGVILVTRSGLSRRKALARACDVLSRSGANVLGFVLNAVRRPEYYYEYPDSYKELVTGGQAASTQN